MTALDRAIHAEAIRIGGARGAMTALLISAVGIPLAITLAVAALAEHVAAVAGPVTVTSVSTTNAAYWVISLAPVAGCAVAAYSTAAAPRGRAGVWDGFLVPHRAVSALARWLVFGGLAASAASGLTALVLVCLPTLFERVYGAVSISSPEGLRLVWVTAISTFLLVGAAIGVARLLGHPVAALATVLVWSQIVEPGIALVPGAATGQRYVPFLTALYASGQDLVFAPPFSPNGALGYLALLCGALFIASLLRRVPRG